MAVRTGGNRSRLLFPQFAANDFGMDFFDLGMAIHASPGYVIGRSGRPRILMGQDKMIAMAIITGGGDDESPFE